MNIHGVLTGLHPDSGATRTPSVLLLVLALVARPWWSSPGQRRYRLIMVVFTVVCPLHTAVFAWRYSRGGGIHRKVTTAEIRSENKGIASTDRDMTYTF